MAARAQILRANVRRCNARSWPRRGALLGTPYHHQASLKGVGCDCLGLLRGVWRGVMGQEPEAPPAYSFDWAEASRVESLRDAARRHLIEIAPGEFRRGRRAPLPHVEDGAREALRYRDVAHAHDPRLDRPRGGRSADRQLLAASSCLCVPVSCSLSRWERDGVRGTRRVARRKRCTPHPRADARRPLPKERAFF